MKKLVFILVVCLGLGLAVQAGAEWRFGIMADTQSSGHPDVSLNGVSVRLMAPVVDRLVNVHQVDMMMHVGDLTGGGGSIEFDQWLTTAAPLFDAGIDVFPIRGNHDDGAESDIALTDPLYGDIEVKATDIWDAKFPYLDPDSNEHNPIAHRGPGASYVFDYNNTRFVAMDIYGAAPSLLIQWLQTQEIGNNDHMFVYAHEPFFGRSREGMVEDTPYRMLLIEAMAGNGAEAYFSGHDHQYSRSAAVKDGDFLMHHLVTGSNAEKYYRFEYEINTGDEVGFKQINDQVGYTVVTIDGPLVRIEHFSSFHPDPQDPDEVWNPEWILVDRTVYSTNGSQYAVEAQGSYAGLGSASPVGSEFVGTTALILDGTNETWEEVTTDPDESITPVASRMGNLVSFGWQTRESLEDEQNGHTPAGDVLLLDGMADNPGAHTDAFVLQLSYDDSLVEEETGLRLAGHNGGTWTRAILANDSGSSAHLVYGPWEAGYGLGTYGIDVAANTVWAVLDHDGSFAVVDLAGPEGDLNDDGIVDRADAGILRQHLRRSADACPACDIDGDGRITVRDARKLVTRCTCGGCTCPR